MRTKSTATAAIILETRIKRKDGTHPVKLRITHNRQQRYYTMKRKTKTLAFNKATYSKITADRPRGDLKEIKIFVNELEKRATDIIESLPVFSFDAFERKCFGASEDEKDLFSCLKNKAAYLRTEGRISTAVAYECALNSLKKFTDKSAFSFDGVDVPFLNKYEKWMLDKGNSNTTTGIYLRNVRTMFNEAQRNGSVLQEQYPFGKGKYQIPTGDSIKKALTQAEVSLIAHYRTKAKSRERYFRDLWLFSFLCNGINVKDIARLKYSNIDEDTIVLLRAKTARETKSKPQRITIVITQRIGRIIDQWGNKPGTPDKYIFPILEKGCTPEQEYDKVYQAAHQINKYIGEIAETVGITQKVTTYVARHTFATVLKRSGASMEFISESLGHKNLKTTASYLDSFEMDEKRKWAKKIAKF